MAATTHMTIRALAERWGVSATFIRRAIWNGQLKATRFGRAVRIPVAEADHYAQTATQGGKQ